MIYCFFSDTSTYTEKSFFPFSCGNPHIPLLDQPGTLPFFLFSLFIIKYSTSYQNLLGWPKNKLPYLTETLDKIIVITDGTCGSACSLFITKLQMFQKALYFLFFLTS